MSDLEPAPLTRREAASAPEIIAKTLGLCLAVATMGGLLVEAGVWKGQTDNKVGNLSEQVSSFGPRLVSVESQALTSKQDLESVHRDVEQLRLDVNKRLDHQMDRLNAIADRVGVPPAPGR